MILFSNIFLIILFQRIITIRTTTFIFLFLIRIAGIFIPRVGILKKLVSIPLKHIYNVEKGANEETNTICFPS